MRAAIDSIGGNNDMWTSWTTSPDANAVASAMFSFMPSWWWSNYGISHGERTFSDPEYRAETQREMNRIIFDRFGDMGLGEADPQLVFTSGHLGNATMPPDIPYRIKEKSHQVSNMLV